MPPKPNASDGKVTATTGVMTPGNGITDEHEEYAERYGWAVAVFKSDPELWKLLNQAIKNDWSTGKFVAELRRKRWFKKHSEVWRENEVLRITDPGTYKQKYDGLYAEVQDMAANLTGSELAAPQVKRIVERALAFGWNDAQMRNAVAGFLKQQKGGGYGGEAGEAEAELRAYAADQGVNLSAGNVSKWLKSILAGKSTIQGYKSWIQQQAMSTYPGLGQFIKEGKTVRQLADPYMNLMAEVWEANPEAIKLNNATLLKALQFQNKDGTGALMNLGDFRRMLKQDPRYLSTTAAVNDATDIGHQILKDFGLVG
ncbi:hypothetical protein [Actinocorallia libanotica]|uniref:Uncharacterized protein n=1 Tax=Actinocorallia libanotica TaxID=46162 RepID=A0ABN1Q1Q0_9ACTN